MSLSVVLKMNVRHSWSVSVTGSCMLVKTVTVINVGLQCSEQHELGKNRPSRMYRN